ncbi:transporter substrate-binding domain-containing protein [Litorivicinus lipolyticus]|uniref:Transporter substrate-binding domain-containing protein n=1 Tax=Litorivicinus lipolyticus TaxID=418701 RepID=A0A5Q2Q953_9GAMM|nr:transporter substrate-binding domain-containing protein [Litorivicinus lipolyticus]QGG80738.1 transporter substrate-binding domain-containing protein [Litorivicinus lipolyticus]
MAADLDVKIDAMDWAEAQNRLLAGNVDALMQINPNPERLERMAFSDPLLATDFTLFRRTERLDLIGADSLNGQRIGAERASFPAELVARIDGAIPVDIDHLRDGLRAVSVGTLDGILVDNWVGLHLIQQLGIENLTPPPPANRWRPAHHVSRC